MEIPKLVLVAACVYSAAASHYSHTIPVEGYETKLQDLGQHVEIPETPVKVIKITKTVAVKVPVPYPVKIKEKIPYPVHVAKPYPVPVPQIIKVPQIVNTQSSHENEGASGGNNAFQNIHELGRQNLNSYQVQETPHELPAGEHSFSAIPNPQSFDGGRQEHGQNIDGDYSYEASPGNSYDAPASSYHGYSDYFGSIHDSDESKSYDQAIKDYFNKHQFSGQSGSSSGYNYQ